MAFIEALLAFLMLVSSLVARAEPTVAAPTATPIPVVTPPVAVPSPTATPQPGSVRDIIASCASLEDTNGDNSIDGLPAIRDTSIRNEAPALTTTTCASAFSLAYPAVDLSVSPNPDIGITGGMPMLTCCSFKAFVEVPSLKIGAYGNEFEMPWILAACVATKMVNRHPFWDSAVGELVCKTVRRITHAFAVLFDSMPAIPEPASITEPRPTSISPTTAIDFTPEPVGVTDTPLVQGVTVATPPAPVQGTPTTCDGWPRTPVNAAERLIHTTILSYDWPCVEALAVVYGPTPPNPRAPIGCPNGESGGRADVVSAGGHAGLFQLAQIHEYRFIRRGWTWADALDAERNTAIAHELYVESGRSWSHWSCRP